MSISMNDSRVIFGKSTDNPRKVRCHVAVLREEDGGFSAVVLNLPGVGSCGPTENEAITNARGAVAATVESFEEDSVDIPWSEPGNYEIPEGAKLVWILVDV